MSALTEATREVTTLFSELMETLIKDQPEKPLDFLIDHLSSQAVSDDKLKVPKKKRTVIVNESQRPSPLVATRRIPKSAEQAQQIRAAVQKNILFASIDDEQLTTVIDALQLLNFKQGDIIIKQGDSGDMFYIIETGSCDVFKKETDQSFPGHLVAKRGVGESFGELALMYNTPRAATVIAANSCSIWSVDRHTFQQVILNKMFIFCFEFEGTYGANRLMVTKSF
jgi:hypothetical protein